MCLYVCVVCVLVFFVCICVCVRERVKRVGVKESEHAVVVIVLCEVTLSDETSEIQNSPAVLWVYAVCLDPNVDNTIETIATIRKL